MHVKSAGFEFERINPNAHQGIGVEPCFQRSIERIAHELARGADKIVGKLHIETIAVACKIKNFFVPLQLNACRFHQSIGKNLKIKRYEKDFIRSLVGFWMCFDDDGFPA